MLSPESLNGRPLGKIPDSNSLVLTAGNDEFVFGVEQCSGNVVEVSSARVNFPSLGLAHSPDFDLPVVCSRNDERERGVERRVVDSTVVAFQYIFHCREIVESVKSSGRRVRSAFSKTGNIPNSNGLIHGGRNDKIFLGVELRRHNVVRMTGENGYTVPRRAVPNPNGLVIRS